jgi:L-asparaginase II
MDKLLTIYRGNVADLFVFGSLVVVDTSGRIIYAKGDPNELVFPRSSEKLIQALATLSLGAKDSFQMTGQEIAQICSSHRGEVFHVRTIRELLQKAGLDESYLKCGAHYPFKPEVALEMKKRGIEAEAIHNNCSGKHTGMLLGTKLLGASLNDYYMPEHPIQQRILELLSMLCDYPIADEQIAIDGCGVPVHALPLCHFAYGMARFADTENLPEYLAPHAKDIMEAIMSYPEYISGTDGTENYIIKKYPRELVLKGGANGYFTGILTHQKYGFALKTYDGISEYRDIILLELLKKMGIIRKEDEDYFDRIFDKKIRNHRGEVVGETKVNF